MIISLGQMHLYLGEPERNLEQVRAWTEEAARRGSQLVVFPELWPTAYDLEHWPQHADRLGEGMFAQLSALARAQRLAIASSVLEARDGRAYNTLALYGADGSLQGLYRKVHLVPMLDEPKWLAAGDALTVAAADWGPTGLGICYDLRFPEMWRRYALAGARLFLLPAEWPSRRAAHWRTLLRARAIENQVFVAACNRVGESKGETFGGCSAVIDPWGEPAAEADGEAEVLITAEIDLARVDEIRARIPVFQDRRPDLY
ncbi:MAG: carbon-nitrogen family hydrolase [Anaerolineales bacterium]|nr:carbon-nitrogen family hydrolase [Anaerolineales bacterium]